MEFSQKDIINRILNDATKEAGLIVKNAEKSAKLLLENQRQTAQNQAKKEANSILKRAKNEAEIIRGKTSNELQRRASWTVLSEKNRLIQNVIDTVNDQLISLKTPKYVQFLEKLTNEAGLVLGGGKLTVHLTERDSDLILNFTKLSKQISEKTGVTTNLSISKERIHSPGILVKKVDSKIFVDNTIKSILERQKKLLKIKIAKILFTPIEVDNQNTTQKL
jgi:vacuolar-type H+-ATPase subunit E/Vma4